jgi:hypothetical protein
MSFIITLAGSTEPVVGTEHLTEETLQSWLDENQVYYLDDDSEGKPETGDLTKYIVYRTEGE